MQKSIWDEMTNKYSLSKTLRFELKPVGKTLENIQIYRLVNEDEKRDKKFKQVKKITDEYYRYLIEISLNNLNFEKNELNEVFEVYKKIKKEKNRLEKSKLNENLEKKLKKLLEKIHKQVWNEDFEKNNFDKELIKKNLPKWLEEKNRLKDKELVEKFQNWTTYFRNYFDTRKNIFSKEEIPTSIFYRIVYDNLPKYFDNLIRLEELKEYNINFTNLEKDFEFLLNGKNIFDYFNIENFHLFLNQSGIDNYNKLVGGFVNEKNEKIKGINEYLNEFSQKYYEENLSEKELNDKKKKIRSKKLVVLFKQILINKEKPSFILKEFQNSDELLWAIEQFKQNNLDKYLISEKEYKENLFSDLKELFRNLENYDVKKIYLNKNNINNISNDLFSEWDKINNALYEINVVSKKTNLSKKETELIEKEFENRKFFSLFEIQEAIDLLNKDNESKRTIYQYLSEFKEKNKDLFLEIEKSFNEFQKINLNNQDLRNESMSIEVVKIKNYLDSIEDLLRFVKVLNVNIKSEKKSFDLDIDSDFYNKFNPIYDSLSKIVPLYNAVRNYVTQKQFKTGKYKLNFNCSTLGKGWDQNKIDNQNYTLIFKEKKDYYLGILNVKKDKTILNAKKNKDIYLKDSDLKIMILKTLGDIKKQLPRIAFSKRYKDFPDITIIENYYEEYKKYKKPKNKKEFDKDKAFKLIDYFKYILKNHPENYLKIYNIKLKDNNEFMTLEEFLDDITKQFYKLSLESINKDYILSQVEKGNLYLFKIHNKDFSEFSKGKKNLHTLYFESLFSDENLKDVVYKLSGNAELFYRKGSPNNPVIHPKNQKIKNKNPINNKTESLFTYDIIKDKRYKEDKFFFHCPIELNYKSSNKSNVNSFIYSIISKSENINVLGIDRGERNLIYYSLINLKGEILKQGSLNIIVDEKGRQINYLEKLDQLEKERQEAKKNWKAITKIKELKEGYLSYVIHQLSKMIIENNAIVILEDLNSGFKTGRIKIEKQIYQKFERKLIEKLNYLVFKDINSKEAGGLLKAYQLTNKFESFKKLGRQSGILFYVNARNTSKIDPTTGFINKLWPNFINISKAKEFFSNFDEIYYNKEEGYFVFKFKYINFKNIKIDDNKSEFYNKVWEVCTYGTRWTTKLIKNTNKYEYVEVNLTQELKRLFDKYSINYDSSYNIKEQILIHNEADFFKSLIHYLKLTLQLRNLNETEDYILSCVKNKNNEFFDSRKAKENEPKDGDANGAYNIAVKGLIIVDKIKNAEKSEKFDLKIEEPEYLDFVFKKNK